MIKSASFSEHDLKVRLLLHLYASFVKMKQTFTDFSFFVSKKLILRLYPLLCGSHKWKLVKIFKVFKRLMKV